MALLEAWFEYGWPQQGVDFFHEGCAGFDHGVGNMFFKDF